MQEEKVTARSNEQTRVIQPPNCVTGRGSGAVHNFVSQGGGSDVEADVLQARIKKILDQIEIGQVGWEGDEDVMTFNRKPIGATISKRSRLEIGRWWPDLKRHLSSFIAENLLAKSG